MDQKSNKKQCDKKYVAGDLLWAKLGKYPFWPCMVSHDPYEGCYSKKKKIQATESIIYHVQYFGSQRQHGWTSPGLIFPFEGEQAYYATRRQLKKNETSAHAKRRIEAKYSVAPRMLEGWVLAVREAEDAMEIEVEERYKSYVFKYDFNFEKSGSKKGASKRVRKEEVEVEEEKEEEASNSLKKDKIINGSQERLCRICGKGKIDLICAGICSQYFHKECIGSTPGDYKCVYCEQGSSTCFICKKAGTSCFKCSKCDYHYHEECLKKFTHADAKKKICSYHVCLSCCNENSRKSSEDSFINCIQCPTAFHATLHCMPVGSLKLSSSTMICPEHFLGKNKISPQITTNVSYCSVCAEGGELICCESCPNSYHTKCINTTKVPTGDFCCEDCKSRQYLYVGMIVWAKTGNFRWWPAQIANEQNLPIDAKNMENYNGEFPVQYFGTNEYFWTHRGRVIPFAERHKDYCRSAMEQFKDYYYYKLSTILKMSLVKYASFWFL